MAAGEKEEPVSNGGGGSSRQQGSLQPDAKPFLPGAARFKLTEDQSSSSRAEPKQSSNKVAVAAALTGTETMAERIQHALLNNIYECCICVEPIRRHEAVYEDQHCWTVFHLKCIISWAKRALQPTEGRPLETWRCPACQSQSAILPREYRCWCGKHIRPEPNKLAPHACGQTCGKQSCPHPCPLPCHPGPCPPCQQMGTAQQCFCGKHVVQKRCINTDYTLGSWSCQEVCGEIMPCDEHHCERACHPGLCGACNVPLEQACRCGKHTKAVRCSDMASGSVWTCQDSCGMLFECGIHQCEEQCHVHNNSEICPRSPKFVKSCPCGQTPLDSLLKQPRSACTDNIPTCGKTCSRLLTCGHTCTRPCHTGACGECQMELHIPCGCGSTQVKASCQDIQLGLQPACDKVCRAQKNCLRHICTQRCCTGYSAAQKRKAKRSRQQTQTPTDIEPEHLCTEPCNRPLSCGNHHCAVLCHRGPCPPCLEATFEEIACACGGTVLSPPIACGALLPVCLLPCTRPTACGHPPIPHDCHQDTVSCPRCPYLVERLCLCGKTPVKNQPCWQKSVSCGQLCDKVQACGHACKLRCHAGSCEACTQPCGKLRACGHGCAATCHYPEKCPDVPCNARVDASCACGNIKLAVCCGTSTALECTDFCAAVVRSQKLAEALGGGSSKTTATSLIEYPTDLVEYYKDNKIWCTTIESAMREFCVESAKVKLFKPMRTELRQFVHELAEVYGMRSESLDEGPHRAVQISKTSGTFMPRTRLAHAAPVTATSIEQLRRPAQAYNAFVLLTLQFGLTTDALSGALSLDSKLRFDVQFTADGENAYLLPTDASKGGMSTDEVEAELVRLKPRVKQLVTKQELAGLCELCWLNKDGIMSYREGSRKRPLLKPKEAVTETRNAFEALTIE
ncbi:hypothetical protein BCR37DRAFT_357681 [Protomyces lactucae-debilis]|uniref:R3H domain-containing protein n=1 Tax=Protomyces lactucae-debilis TaxID=2754530 RepID=A0A1Y2FF23_PROLT|nr:uncharacterized protein BCR37DRAFT_357681 [Protomyces lactucae-debilis]ORY82511.1 hypothetical protein BCR37DRAFT_357681 [Protomyces lactucae-debilis]